ncbi:MAG: hypothetical protein HZB10_02645 [Candidatus Yonathbacteria bacterium]|nr:hypothetical protein [Candidatus Yonathbacteria bacterium]
MPSVIGYTNDEDMDVISNEHLEDHGSPDGLAVSGSPICLSNVQSENENIWGHKISGQAFLAFDGSVGCLHA